MKLVVTLFSLAVAVVLGAWWFSGGDSPRGAAAPSALVAQQQTPAEAPTSIEPSPTARMEAPALVVELAREEPAQHTAPEWRLDVLDQGGEAIAQATVVVLEVSGVSWSAVTDARGSVRALPAEGVASTFVAGPGRTLEYFLVERSAGARAVRLTRASAQLAGSVTVNGAVPDKPLLLAFEPAQAPFPDLVLPRTVRAQIDGLATTATYTDAAGRFRVDGVPHDWSGALRVPDGYLARPRRPDAAGERRIPIAAPSANFVFEFERLRHLVGRVVNAHGQPAAKGAELRVALHWADADSVALDAAPFMDNGRFEIAIGARPVATVEFSFASEAGLLALERRGHELQPDARGDLDAGTLRMSARSALRVRVVDSEGAAVRAARARVFGEGRTRSFEGGVWNEASGGDEILIQTSASGAATLSVIAPGFWSKKTEVVLPHDALVEVRLERTNRLALECVDAAGAPVQDVVVRLAGRGEALFPESTTWFPDSDMIGVATGYATGGGQDVGAAPRGWMDLRPSGQGHIALEGLAPALPLDLIAFDARGRRLLERGLAPLGVQAQRAEKLVIVDPLVELVGRVLDPGGQPIEGAALRLKSEDDDFHGPGTVTSSSGRYSFRGLSGSSVSIAVTAPGFKSAAPLVAELSSRTTEFDIVLQRP